MTVFNFNLVYLDQVASKASHLQGYQLCFLHSVFILLLFHLPHHIDDSVHNLGVIFDSDFSFHKHMFLIYAKSCLNYHISDLPRSRRHLPLSTAKTISNSLITSRLDYWNSLINNIAKQDLSKLHRVQNCLARVVGPY